MSFTELESYLISRKKRALSTRRVPPLSMLTLITVDIDPVAGDHVLACVDVWGKQTKLELTDGRRAHMFSGNEIVVSYGDRYAPDQCEAIVCQDLPVCDLVAAGGIARAKSLRHVRMQPPTQITSLGLIGGDYLSAPIVRNLSFALREN